MDDGRVWYFSPVFGILMATQAQRSDAFSMCLHTETLDVFTAGELSLSLNIYTHIKPL